MTPLDVIKSWAETWRSLAAWRAPLNVEITVKPQPKHVRRLGTAQARQKTAIIYAIGDLAEDLGTALHEMAHLAAPVYVAHERPWREIFVAAATEALGCNADLFDLDVTVVDLDAQVVAAVDGWLARTGQITVLRALGIIPARAVGR